LERGSRSAAAAHEEAAHRAGAARQAGEGDVGEVGPPLGLQSGAGDRLIDLLVQRLQGLVRRDAGPQGGGCAAALEAADTGERNLERRVEDGGERGVDVSGLVAIHFPDEAEREMELVVLLPAGAADAAHHCEQMGTDVLRRPDRDEQAVHGVPLSPASPGARTGFA
jgi:hypothetical protein